MRTRVQIFILVFFFSLQCNAQKFINLKTYNVDSLLNILPDQKAEDRVNALNQLAVSLSFVDYDLSIQYADEAMNLSEELDYKVGMADAFRNYGHVNFSRGNYPTALNNYLEAMSRYEKLDLENTAAWVCYDIAKTHYCANNFEKTIDYGHIALDKFRQPFKGNSLVGDVRDTIRMLEGLALTYGNLGMTDKSRELYLKVIEVGHNNDFDPTELLIMTSRIGVEYYIKGNIDSARLYFEKALAFPDLNPSIKALKYRPFSALGDIHYLAGEIDSALFYKQKAFDWYYNQGYLFWSMLTSNQLGAIYFKSNQLAEAERSFLQSERIYNEMIIKNSWYRHDSLKYIVNFGIELFFPLPPRLLKEMMWGQAKSMYHSLYQINEKKKTGNTLKYYIAYSEANDSLTNLLRNREIIEIQTKYETEGKDQQIDFLSKENEFKDTQISQSRIILFGLAGLVILIISLAIVLIRQNKLKEQQKNLVLQQKLFRSQMNPHFLFNSLSSIHNFMLNEKPDKAATYLSRFSKLVRAILNSSVKEYNSISEEISAIENYLELQKVRFPGKFDFKIEMDGSIEPDITNIPSMLSQPFIENALEHGIQHKNAKGIISIRFNIEGDLIVIEVEDNGIGREKAREIKDKQNKDHKSLGTEITNERIQVLNKSRSQKIKLNILDLKNKEGNPAGTRVIIQIPIKN